MRGYQFLVPGCQDANSCATRIPPHGSSMEKVLKVTVYLAKAEDYAAMNEVFLGRFGENPPVPTTTAAAWVPGNSLVEMDVIAYL